MEHRLISWDFDQVPLPYQTQQLRRNSGHLPLEYPAVQDQGLESNQPYVLRWLAPSQKLRMVPVQVEVHVQVEQSRELLRVLVEESRELLQVLVEEAAALLREG